jgi:NADH dehydrogenase
VRALTRDRDKAREVLPSSERLSIVVGDVTDEAALASLVRGCWAAVNCIGIIRESGASTFQRAHVDAVRELVKACRAEGVKRFVQISALGVWDEGPARYQKTKFEGESIVKRSDLDWTILRPSIVHGVGSDFLRLAKGWVTGDSQPWFFLPYFSRGVYKTFVPLAAKEPETPKVQPVAVEDVAWAVGAALEKPESIGEIYNLVGPDVLTWPQMLIAIRDAVPGANRRLKPLGIPGDLAALQAKVAGWVGLGGLLPFDEGMALMGAIDSTASLDKARSQLGFEPRAFVPALKGYAASL